MSYELIDKKRLKAISFFVVCFLLITLYSSLITVCSAELLNRVVAYVDDSAITMHDFQETHARMRMKTGDISEEDVVNSMINRQLLLKEAKKMRLEAATRDDLLKDYIDIKIKASILIKENDIERFYKEHRGDFKGRDYSSVREEIDIYLFETEVNRQLKKHLDDLRANAEIKVQLSLE